MLHYALVFFLIAILLGVFGFGALAGTAALVAKIFFIAFIVLAILSGFSHFRNVDP